MMNLMNQISVTLIQICSSAVIDTAYFDGKGISFDDIGIANYRLIEQEKINYFELWILLEDEGEFLFYDGELSEEAQRVANMLFDVAWMKQEGEVVYQEDRFGVPCEVLRYEEATEKYFGGVDFETEILADPSVPF